MVKMRRTDYHPLEIVVKAAFILLIVGETTGDSKQELYEPTIEKYSSPLQSSIYPNYESDRPYLPLWYYVQSQHKLQPYKDDKRDQIVFPQDDFVSLRFQEANILNNPPKCTDSTFCEIVSNYPTEAVRREYLKDKSIKKLGIVDTITDITQRIDKGDETPLCVSAEHVVFPKVAKTLGDNWLFVAQLKEENFTQGVRVERCVEDAKPCKVIDGFASGYDTKCKQRYIYRMLVAMTSQGLRQEYFRLPSSCCCVATMNGRTKRNPFLVDAEDIV